VAFDPDTRAATENTGMHGIDQYARARYELLGGRFSLASRLGGGVIEVAIPLAEALIWS
jgi:signal transduction histidine kinase